MVGRALTENAESGVNAVAKDSLASTVLRDYWASKESVVERGREVNLEIWETLV